MAYMRTRQEPHDRRYPKICRGLGVTYQHSALNRAMVNGGSKCRIVEPLEEPPLY